MKCFQVIVTPNAQENIEHAYAWLQEEDPHYAQRWLQEIRDKILELATLPKSHAIAPESTAFETDVRQLLVGRGTPWRVFFTIDDQKVYILHVRHGRQDYWRPE
uniref:Plasmid stabilization system n=1 Tax=Magnetococcus massalia (strain MO-1) TaxID=451514 RepID=A0A1S7LH62_MAGMO|nr:conserved protein of unknown function [Candidatus Magnetococcus massalia]